MQRRWLNWSAMAAVLGSIVYAFGPVLLDKWLDDDSASAQQEINRQQTEVLGKNAELLENLNKTLQELSVQPDAPGDAERQTPPPEKPEPPAPKTFEALSPQAAPDSQINAAAPPQPKAPAPAAPEPLETIALPAGEHVFGVFEGQNFNLCSHSDFRAELTSKDGVASVLLTSTDRSVPGRGFRGFEKTIPLQTPVMLWEGCTIAIGSAEERSNLRRLIISVAEGDAT